MKSKVISIFLKIALALSYLTLLSEMTETNSRKEMVGVSTVTT